MEYLMMLSENFSCISKKFSWNIGFGTRKHVTFVDDARKLGRLWGLRVTFPGGDFAG